ncbi:MAG: hypothetical protein P1P81_02330, partial [Desulfobulbales bacterium]|nr:hypothetical protein [Desulfobulbales bacterium]
NYLALAAANVKGYVGAMPAGPANCSQCHISYFDSHVHGVDGGYINHTVIFSINVDIGQNNAACNTCHSNSDADGVNGRFSSWTDIVTKHVNCAACHSYVDDGTPPKTTSDGRIAMPGTQSTCVDCHTPKEVNATAPSHGGHSPTDFVFTTTCLTSCHPGGDTDIHQMHVDRTGDCGTCHVSTSGGGTLQGSALNQTVLSSCADCHGSTVPATVHHGGASAQAGNCTVCHADPRETNNRTTYSSHLAHAPYQPACGYCHVDVNGNDVQVMAITVGIAGSTATGTPAGNTRTLAPGHQFTITSGTGVAKITNYGVCFDCHGTTGYTADKAGVKTALGATNGVTPFHGAVTYGAAGTQLGGQGKGAADDTVFRIGNVQTALAANKAYWGPGRGVWNIRNAERSIQDHYLNAAPVATWKVNLGGYTDDYTNNATSAGAGNQTAGSSYTFTRWWSRNGGGYVVVPVVDSDYAGSTQCSASCDTVAIDLTSSKGTAFTRWDTRVLHVHATSTDTSAQLYAVFGGHTYPMTCSSGDCTLVQDFSGETILEKWDGSNIVTNTLYVVSDKGGSAKMEGGL